MARGIIKGNISNSELNSLLIFFSICSILLMTSLQSDNNINERIVLVLTLFTVIFFWFTKNWFQAFLYAFILTILLESSNNSNIQENYENKDIQQKEYPFIDTDSNDDVDDDQDDEEVDKLLRKYLKNTEKFSTLNDKELNLINDNKEEEKEKKAELDDPLGLFIPSDKKMNDFTPGQAQRATVKLIDTVKKLQSTIEHLGPTLKMGHDVMKTFEKFEKFK